MKVRELISELQKHDSDCDVVTEGCDCCGEVGSVVKTDLFFTANNDPIKTILLRRPVEE